MDNVSKQLLIGWYAWIMQDMIDSNNCNTFFEYVGLMDWMQYKFEYEDLDPTAIIKFDDKSYLSFWFEFERAFDKQSLLDMKQGKEYEIKKQRGKYVAVEICN